ncbi:creatininase family protein [Candidatus Liberibacter americanus]|uniref:Creatinine amidohydrolase n=1 Tax=Candidatus Liberibacter americanus str. Sao Paulo TaxID=1261131 RepID=U6B2V5_9HYPH|nr:creatininase family protein [Candidatus Liberibacter americanus]AHA27394.1 Creatinine amidohydrolase [Candidatus Liberibacter americanus str. Sao Paulo]EMS36667.1 creatinine amidohydrolase [Candidatus Liberibacter americanus PW_SP]
MVHPSLKFGDNSSSLNIFERKDWIVVLPLGAYEQHGPHLPMDTDTIIVNGLVERVISILPSKLPVTFMPAESIGYSIEHMYADGTKTLSYNDAIERWLYIINQLHNFGIFKVIMLNAHGGNSPILPIVAIESRVRFSMLVAYTSWSRFVIPNDIISAYEKEIGIHGGETETSMMLALAPHLVNMNLAKNFSSRQTEFMQKFKYLRAYGPHSFGWSMDDLNSAGVVGSASSATAEKGERLLSHISSCFISLLEDIDIFNLDIFNTH